MRTLIPILIGLVVLGFGKKRLLLFGFLALFTSNVWGVESAPVNVVWIVIEDASPHIGCYGETLIKTPHIDRMAREGIRCSSAFVTAPVCSSSRSAMVSGMYQTTLGVHNHRSQVSSEKAEATWPITIATRCPSR